MSKHKIWAWVSGAFALLITSVPAWLDYLKIPADSWISPIKNFLSIKFDVQLPVLIGGTIFVCLIFWILIQKGSPLSKIATKKDSFFERDYTFHGARFKIYTYEGKSALLYQGNDIHDKVFCAEHALELVEVRAYEFNGKACPFHGCEVRLGWQPYNQALHEAKSKFLLALQKQ